MMIAECVENKMAFKSGQKDSEGNAIALGSCEFRIGGSQSNLGQVSNHLARPASFCRRIPAIGEMVILYTGPCNDVSTSSVKGNGFLYATPLNSVDDLNLHSFSKIWKRKGLVQGSNPGERPNDKDESGRSFKSGKKVQNIQIFEGDDLIEGRWGTSVRFGSTVKSPLDHYEKKPTWEGSTNGDPILYFRVVKPSGETANKYTIEDIEKDDSTIVLTSNQKLKNFKAGFDKNLDAKKLAQFEGKSQIAINSNRVVLNANKDMLLLIGKTKAVLTGEQVLFQSKKYKVDLDDLMDFLKKWLGEDVKLSQGSSQYATPAGPTGPATSMAQYLQLQQADFNKFKQP